MSHQIVQLNNIASISSHGLALNLKKLDQLFMCHSKQEQ
jgi:hypothetical protein